jgi:hypothetical protein
LKIVFQKSKILKLSKIIWKSTKFEKHFLKIDIFLISYFTQHRLFSLPCRRSWIHSVLEDLRHAYRGWETCPCRWASPVSVVEGGAEFPASRKQKIGDQVHGPPCWLVKDCVDHDQHLPQLPERDNAADEHGWNLEDRVEIAKIWLFV